MPLDDSLSGALGEMLARLYAAEAQLAAISQGFDEDNIVADIDVIGPAGGDEEKYSFKVTRADEDHVEIAPGAFIVVHISRVEKSAAQVAVGLDGYIYSKCVYAGANTEWDDEWTFDTAYPPESPHYKIVVLAEIKNGEIIQRHCGDVEAYPFGEACDE